MFSTVRLESVAAVRRNDGPQINADRHSNHRGKKPILAVNRRRVAAMGSVAGWRGTARQQQHVISAGTQRTGPLFANGRFIGGCDCWRRIFAGTIGALSILP
jgi:hypothetical protein